MIKKINSEHLKKANELLTIWEVDSKSFYEFNLQGLYFSLYDNKDMSGKPLLEKEYIESEWESFSEFEDEWSSDVNLTLKKQEKSIDPEEYFNNIKRSKQIATSEALRKSYESCYILLEKALRTGQTAAANKIIFHMDCVEKEEKIVSMGIDRFIYKNDIEEFITKVEGKVVKIIDLKNYEREIPDEIADTIEKTKDIFTDMYVLFTDYTGKEERKIEKDKIKKDPIIFGVFSDTKTTAVVDRFYVLGEWEDDYCDLTLDKVVSTIGEEKLIKIRTPKTLDEFREDLIKITSKDNTSPTFLMNNIQNTEISKKVENNGFFKKVKSFLGV